MFVLSWSFALVVVLISTFLYQVLTFLFDFKLLLFSITTTMYILGIVRYLYLPSSAVSWTFWPIESYWEKFKVDYLIATAEGENIHDEEIDIDIDSLRKTGNQEFLSLHRRERNKYIIKRLKMLKLFGRAMPTKACMSNLNNFCFISVFLVTFSYRLLISLLLLPIKIVLTQFFFIIFSIYYVKLYFSTKDKKISIPCLHRFIESNYILRLVFQDIIFEPLDSGSHDRKERRQEWLRNPKRQWVSYTLYYYVIWHICIVPYYGAFQHLQALNFILSNKRQCKSESCVIKPKIITNTNTKALTILFLILYLVIFPSYKLHSWLALTVKASYVCHISFSQKTLTPEGVWVSEPRDIEDNQDFMDLVRKPFYSIEADVNLDRRINTYINACQKALVKDNHNYIFSVTIDEGFPLHDIVRHLQNEITLIKYTYNIKLKNTTDDSL